ncbi:hypothetical protein AAFF_G00072380 [Aldrovandia affinis]|uniref:Uncharacterized protein n=1 Tax=Aldrovandia affinis TaxID=143900 RepID=A0AAD7RYN2_9TELE|nr:hypothetical protein AAFF_G00072380 [Aldrovandia affinis]
MRIIERFVILLYDRTSKCTDIDKARRKLFARKNNVQLIPPTKAALGTCQEGSVSRWTCVGSDTAASTRAPSTNQLGLVKDWRRTVHTLLDQAT